METVVNSSSLFENLFNNLVHPVLIFEVVDQSINEFRLFEVNDAACSLLKYSKEEFMTKEALTLLRYVTPKVRRSVKDLLFKNGQITTVLDLPDKNDVMTTVEVNASLVDLGTNQFIVCIIKDYSIRHCHHDALEEENNYLRSIINTIQSFVLILDQEGRIHNWNRYTEQHSGYTLEEVQDQKFWDYFIDHSEKERVITNYLSGKIPLDYENFWLMKNGEKRYIKWKSKTVHDSDGQIQFVLATGVDITDKVESYQELEKSKEKYKALVSSMKDLVFTIDHSLTIKSAYGKWLKSNGFTQEAFEGKSIHAILSDSLHKQNKINQALSGEVTEFEWEMKVKGKMHYFHTVLSPIVLNGNKVNEIVGVTRDITEKKTLEEQHKRIYEALTSGMILHDPSGKIIYANKNASEILGYSEDVLVNMSSMNEEWDAENIAGERFPGEEHPAMRTLRTGEELSNVEMNVYNPVKDEKRWILADTRPILESDGGQRVEYVLATFHDITEKKEIDLLMQQSQKLALIGRLASGVVHEIRNPLTSIMGFLKFVEEGKDKNKIFDYLPVLKMELEQINQFTNEFIELSHSNDHEWTTADLVSIIQSSLDSVAEDMQGQNIQASLETNSNKDMQLYCIEPHLESLFTNLVKNSVEAMPFGGSLTIKVERIEEKVNIQVIDTGKGISSDRLQHLCEPYYSTKEKGTGLGLMRSLKIIHDHNGKIDFSSEEGKGTVVTIELYLNPFSK